MKRLLAKIFLISLTSLAATLSACHTDLAESVAITGQNVSGNNTLETTADQTPESSLAIPCVFNCCTKNNAKTIKAK